MKDKWTGADFYAWRKGQGKHWTQSFAADRLGVSRKQVGAWESDKTEGVDRRTILACMKITDAVLQPVEYRSGYRWNTSRECIEGKVGWHGIDVGFWISGDYLQDLTGTSGPVYGQEAIRILKQYDELIAVDLAIRASTGIRDENGHIGLPSWT